MNNWVSNNSNKHHKAKGTNPSAYYIINEGIEKVILYRV